MDLHLHSYERQHQPDWAAAAVAGLAAGAVLMVLELLWSTLVSGESPWAVSYMISAIVTGPETLQSTDFSVTVVAVALAAHYALGVLFGLVLAAIIVPFRLDSTMGMVLLAGAVFGVVLYLLNFYGMTRFFPWFAELRGAPTVITHLIFGITAAFLYWKFNRQ